MHGVGFLMRKFGKVSSTMTVARELIDQESAGWFIVTAEQQSEGRGTTGRTWSSPVGNLYCTCVVPDIPEQLLPVFPLLVGISLHNAIVQCAALDAKMLKVKWPNDIVFDGKKVAGSIIEQHQGAFLIGVGVNCNVAPEIDDKGRSPTSIAEIKNGPCEFSLDDLANCFAGHVGDGLCNPLLRRSEVVERFASLIDWNVKVHRRNLDGSRGEELIPVKLNEWGNLVAKSPTGTIETLTHNLLF